MQVAIYDITGIQDFIFSSNKLAEILGASVLVQRLFGTFFLELEGGKGCRRVVYAGGGNAMVEFDDEPQMQAANRELARRFLRETGGALRFATSACGSDGASSFDGLRQELLTGVNEKKRSAPGSYPLLGVSVTRTCATDGWPAVAVDDGVPISYPAAMKRQVDEADYFGRAKGLLVGLEAPEGVRGFAFPRELDRLVPGAGDSFVAVVHIDGNNMGRTIEELLQGQSSYEAAAKVMKDLSGEIDSAYAGAMRATIKELATHALALRNVLRHLKRDVFELPIRPIVLNGDDVTFVSNGRVGLYLAECFLKQIAKTQVRDRQLSCCAGVALTKSHFPFARACGLAEELCASAKRKAKALAGRDSAAPGCWLDFHIVQSGVTMSLDALRDEHCAVKGMAPAAPIRSSAGIEHRQHNLLWRPWRVDGDPGDMQSWELFKALCKGFADWPNSKRKAFRNSFIGTEQDIDAVHAAIKSRGFQLPAFPGISDSVFPTYDGNKLCQTPFFDALEASEFYATAAELAESSPQV